MKLGFISDIHGNLHALRKVLEDVDTYDVGLVLCAGDMVCYGAYPNEVVDILRERCVPCVAGNYDDAVAWNRPRAARQPSTPRNEPLKQAALEWAKTCLTPQNGRYLRSLPWTLEFCLDGLRVGVIHAGLEYLDEWHTPDQPAGFLALADHFRADVILLGHSHQSFTYRCDQTLFVNPGAVGRSLDGDLRAAYAVFDTQTRQVDLRRVSYNVEAAAQAIAQSGMPPEIAILVRQGVRRIEEVTQYSITVQHLRGSRKL
jgi:putative phosphoesterase